MKTFLLANIEMSAKNQAPLSKGCNKYTFRGDPPFSTPTPPYLFGSRATLRIPWGIRLFLTHPRPHPVAREGPPSNVYTSSMIFNVAV